MKPTAAERKAITAAIKQMRVRSDFDNKLQREIRSDLVRRRRIASRFRAQIFKKAFKAAGIDQEEIIKRQQNDSKAVLKRMAELKLRVAKNAPVIAKRQATQIELLKQSSERLLMSPHKHNTPPPPAPTEGILLDRTTDIMTDGGTGTKTSSVTPWFNLVQTDLVGFESSIGGSYLQSFDATFCFAYTPDRQGLLHAWSWAIANGSYSWETDFTCDGGASAMCGMNASMSLTQTYPGAVPDYRYVGADSVTLFSKSIGLDSHCTGDFGVEVIDTSSALETPAGQELPVFAGIPVTIVIDVSFYVEGYNGLGNLDFSQKGQQINVPAVILQLY
jgi:hypothetical protein